MSVIDKLKEEKYGDAISELKEGQKKGVTEAYKEYNNDRSVRDTQVGKRRDKITKKETVKVAKIPIPFQRKVVQSASVFLFGTPVKLVPNESNDSWDALDSFWSDLRMDSMLLDFAKKVKSETEAAIVFYHFKKETDKETKIKARVLSQDNGTIYTNFDEYGDLVSFGWEYTTKVDGEEVERLRVWTADMVYDFDREKLIDSNPNLFGKIPVVYLSQKNTEWWEVQTLIDRYEMNFSKFADTNDYFAHPMFKAKGKIDSMPQKDESGKMIRLPIHETAKGQIVEADVDFLTWDHGPESIELELETGKGLIYGLSDTPDLSFDNVKGIGNVSGVALELMFLAPMLKAKDDQGDYNVVISRIINVMKAGLLNITKPKGISEQELTDLYIDVQYQSVLPGNLLETVQMLVEANGGKPIISQESSVAANPLVQDNDEELDRINQEAVRVNSLGDSFNV
ncbi:phage portal protein [Joostella sp.]|uniref:phage portal protein n=1 Tax=Joostella sp. TaxID=2231138 RepID=UPI003A8F5F67